MLQKATIRFGFPILNDIGRRLCSQFPGIQGVDNNFIARPSLGVIASFVYNGTTIPLDLPGLDMKQFFNGAEYAIGRTTEVLAAENLEDSSDMFGKEIYDKLKSRMTELNDETREKLLVKSEDIFFSWIEGVQNVEKASQIKFVALSFPGYAEMKQNMKERTKIEEEMKKEISELVSQKKNIEVIRPKLTNSKIKDINNKRAQMYDSGQIIVTNTTFSRDSDNSSWTLKDFSMKESQSVHTPLGSFLWKFRLKVAIETKRDFLVFLRWDYFTNFLILLATAVSLCMAPSS
ncbi:uncharacterized protein [Lepeophtheirus salmonis]|uniref:uncharacterized protein isoform X2 n=1 Tax=Lepeophtheirus salmonis TaxID=72036 RepID=UPI001AE2F55B|nr:uncharacterized protein LOC121121952 isoform X2 [Lepeophtheirus salmonis]